MRTTAWRMCLVILGVLVLGGGETVLAGDLYVSASAPIFAGTGTTNNPFGMIQAGIAEAWTNDSDVTVHVAPGTYESARIGGESNEYPGGIGWAGIGMILIEWMNDLVGPRGTGRITVRGEGTLPGDTVINTRSSSVPRDGAQGYNCGLVRGQGDKYNNITFENLAVDFEQELWGYGLCGNALPTYANPATPLVFDRCEILFGPNRGYLSGNDGPATAGIVKFRNSEIFLGNADNRILLQWGAPHQATNAAPGFCDGQESSLVWASGGGLVAVTDLKFIQRLDNNGDDLSGAVGFNDNGAFTNFNAEIPNMSVFGSRGYEIVDGDATPRAEDGTLFPTLETVGMSTNHAFVIQNYGGTSLTLTGTPAVVIGGPDKLAFSVSAQPSPTNLAPGEHVTFCVRFRPWKTNASEATVSIQSTDPDESPYTFAVRGVAEKAIAGILWYIR